MPKSNTKFPKNRKNIYLDYASATPIDDRVASGMTLNFKKYFANPSAIHDDGVEVKKKLEQSRREVADILEARSDEIIFTSGATESNNLALFGIVKNPSFVPHIITTNIEHASVLEVCKNLEKTKQAEVTYVQVEKNGIVDPKKIKKAFKKNTVLVSVMYVNNEIGTIQSLREIAKVIRHHRKKKSGNILFHTDATQAVNYLPMSVLKLGVDLMSFNSAKIYGPKGVGVLFKKRGVKLSPISFGGDQEFGLRPGTENLPQISGLADSLKIAVDIREKESKRLSILQSYFLNKLENLPAFKNFGIILNGDKNIRLPNNINITVPKIPSDLLVIELSAKGIMVSAKSACKSGDGKASHVIKAIRPTSKETDGSLRFSLGRQTTRKDIDDTIKSLTTIIAKLEKWY